MTQADSVHSTPPTNTSAETPIGSPAESAGELYHPTPVTPEEAFQAIGRLRKDARAEIDRLLQFLDETENHMCVDDEDGADDEPGGDDELSLGSQDTVTNQAAAWNQPTDYFMGDCEQDDCDDEPSLGSRNDAEWNDQAFWAAPGTADDREDEHDGAEPDDGDNEPSAGFDIGEPSLGWTVDGCTSGGTGKGRYEVEDDLEMGARRRLEGRLG